VVDLLNQEVGRCLIHLNGWPLLGFSSILKCPNLGFELCDVLLSPIIPRFHFSKLKQIILVGAAGHWDLQMMDHSWTDLSVMIFIFSSRFGVVIEFRLWAAKLMGLMSFFLFDHRCMLPGESCWDFIITSLANLIGHEISRRRGRIEAINLIKFLTRIWEILLVFLVNQVLPRIDPARIW